MGSTIIGYVGPPNSDIWEFGQTTVDVVGNTWRCTARGIGSQGATFQLIGEPPVALPSDNEWFNVQSSTYGATGNGTTDDTVAIQAAVTAAAASGGVVYFPPGTYLVSNPINVTGTAVTLRGAGQFASILTMTASFPTGSQVGMVQWGATTGPTIYNGCAVYDLGFDSTAGTDTTKNNQNCLFQTAIPMSYLNIQRIYFNMGAYGQGALLNALGISSGSNNITVRDITAINGAGTVSCYNNGVATSSLMNSITIENIYNYCNLTNMQDDRVAISSNNGGGTNGVESRDISISNVFIDTAASVAGTINGVKLDTGAYGYLHDIEVRNVFYNSASVVSSNHPVICNLGTGIGSGAALQNVTIDGVHGTNCGSLITKMYRKGTAPYLLVRNVHMTNVSDTRLLEANCASAAVGDESVVMEDIVLHTSHAQSGTIPVGVLFAGGASVQGGTGMNRVRNVEVRGTVGVGISNTLKEDGVTVQATGWSNFIIEGCNFSAAASVSDMINTYTFARTAGYNPRTVVAPAFPGTTTTYTNTTGADIYAYVTNGSASMTTTVNGNTGPSLAASATATVFIPSAGTFVPTYASGSPTWVFQGN